MPYTPPSRSPTSSLPATPDESRRHPMRSSSHSNRPSLPRSASFTRHRRSPSEPTMKTQPPKDTVSDKSSTDPLPEQSGSIRANPNIRQSPPPITDKRSMPSGAIVSPPDSSSDSENTTMEMRGRKLGLLKVNKALQDAISQIGQQRPISPEGYDNDKGPEIVISPTRRNTFEVNPGAAVLGDPRVETTRKSGHVHSVSEPRVSLMMKSADASLTTSEEDSDGELAMKPPMVRKKSGELVRPALRPPSRRRPSSMPGTPTFSKAVHFDSHLEHVRHFLQVDRPAAVSATSSPVENYDSDTEYPFSGSQNTPRSPPYEWEIVTANFPSDTSLRRAQAVRLEKVWLPTDQKCLVGSIAVDNLSYHKSVVCRFTLDYWKTTSEVSAEYSHEMGPKEGGSGRTQDRFSFSIKLSDMANLESKTLYFCIRYSVGGQEYWDNNNSTNFQVDFRKKHLPQNGKNNFQGASSRSANGLPRSNRRSNPSTLPRPKTVHVGFDDFKDKSAKLFEQPAIHDFLGDAAPALRFKTKSTPQLPSDELSARLGSPSGQAFSNRYDFGASLRAAKDTGKDGLYMKPSKKEAFGNNSRQETSSPAVRVSDNDSNSVSSPFRNVSSAGGGTQSPNFPAHTSSYDEIVKKFCFFQPKQTNTTSSSAKDDTFRTGGTFDGTRDLPSPTSPPNGSRTLGTSQQPLKEESSYFSPSGLVDFPVIEREGGNPSSPRTTVIQAATAVSSPLRSASPTAVMGTFPRFSERSEEYSYHVQDRFPFSVETHTATAIRG